MWETFEGFSNIDLTVQIKQYYDVFYKSCKVSNFDLIIPAKLKVRLTINRHLLVQDNLDNEVKNQFISAYKGYDPTSLIDPTEYAYQKMNGHGVTLDMVKMLCSYELNKIDENGKKTLIEKNTQQIDKILALYNDDIKVHLKILGDETIGSYLKKNGFKLVLNRSENLYDIENPTQDNIHEGENVPNIQDIIQHESAHLDCTNIQRVEKEIGPLIEYPEFKTVMESITKHIACIDITTNVPVPYFRFAQKILFGYVGHPNNLDQLIIHQIEDCIVKSAIASTVLGVVLGNFPIALASFQTLVIECIKFNVGQDIKCLFPGLYLQTVPVGDGSWKPL